MLEKATLEFDMSKILDRIPLDMNSFEHMEALRIVRFGDKEASGVVRVKMKRGRHPSEISRDKDSVDLEVLSEDGDEYICLFKKNFPALLNYWDIDPKGFGELIGRDLIFDFPMIFTPGKVRMSVRGTRKTINDYLSLFDKLNVPYKIKSIGSREGFENLEGVGLTPRQKEMASTAYSLGYYDRPKRISSKKLAKVFGVKQATLIEHLRKSEKKILGNIFG